MAPAEVQGKDGLLGQSGVGPRSDFKQQLGAGDLERRLVKPARGLLAPVPYSPEHALASRAEPLGTTDAPRMFVILREPGPGDLDLPAAALFLPGQPAAELEFDAENVAQGGQVEDVQRGVIEEPLRERAFGPIGFLAFLGQDDAKMMLE